MKTTLFFICLCYLNIANAQIAKLDKIFEQYKEGKGVTSIKIAKPMFSMLNKLKLGDEELNQIKPLLANINSIKMLIVEDSEDKHLKSEVSKAFAALKYEELVSINSDGNKIRFLTESSQSDNLNNLLLSIVADDSVIFMILDGKVRYEDINKLIDQ
ncbi:DUF4252 domain-containing protein [Sphingobacterium sp. SYP-B4668]|uniref:DUF4252 domain-containing protein n=1 Tax=Sphingobacterium sp. SYP-B4668 TaxID=2996035 RepID=UPI0022DD4669|nr:DUF4252 domain-containing protein [Sphingobacterium sp. SYP-B4668]